MSEPSFLQLKLVIEKGIHRLDHALLERLRIDLPSISRNQLKELFEQKRVELNGSVKPPSWSLLPGSYEVTISGLSTGAEAEQAKPSEKGSFLPIAFENSELLVLNKSSGIPSVPHSSQETETAISSALSHYPALVGVGRGKLEPGLLHRLDTGTSGLLAFAKTNEAYARLHEAWKSGQVKKIYRAWVEGDAQYLSLPMHLELTLAHHPESQKRMIVLPEGIKRKYRGKPLPTSTTVLACHGQTGVNGKIYSDLEVEIETGVMHQIRCTLAHLHLPIAGDPIYHAESKVKSRLMLHAWKLILPSGKDDKTIEVIAPLPSDFTP
jgi:23S rRNA pseudouridine1911/1915/1917 synthase